MTASFMNTSCISFSFLGFFAARSFARLKSWRVSYSSHVSSSSFARGLVSHGGPVDGAGQPAVVVDGAIAEDFEVLGLVRARRFGVWSNV